MGDHKLRPRRELSRFQVVTRTLLLQNLIQPETKDLPSHDRFRRHLLMAKFSRIMVNGSLDFGIEVICPPRFSFAQ
jgi:hypothetical protein